MDLMTDGEALSLKREEAADRAKAERYLLHYAEEVARYQAERAEYIANGVPETAGTRPTERHAVRGMEYDRKSEARRWLQAVEVCERGLSGPKRIFLAARREAEARRGTGFRQGRPGGVALPQHLYTEHMEQEYLAPDAWLADRTVKAWWRRIVDRVVEVELRVKSRQNGAAAERPWTAQQGDAAQEQGGA